jgi:hypothetical protein
MDESSAAPHGFLSGLVAAADCFWLAGRLSVKRY